MLNGIPSEPIQEVTKHFVLRVYFITISYSIRKTMVLQSVYTNWFIFDSRWIFMVTGTNFRSLSHGEMPKRVGWKVRMTKFYHSCTQTRINKKIFISYDANLLISANAALIREFGSLNQSVTNVIYTNGRIDPWLYTGIQESRDPGTLAMVIDSKRNSFDSSQYVVTNLFNFHRLC